jgi:hypothetical protein
MSLPVAWRRPLVALAGGAAVALITRAFADSGQAPALARDLAASTGFPLATTTDLGHPWAVGLLAMGAAWTIWLCLEIRSLARQFGLLAAALGLCLTGSWIAQVGGGVFPTVPVMAALCLAFIAGQLAAGLAGSPARQHLLALLDGKLSPARARALAFATTEPDVDSSRDCLITAIELPASDREFFPVLREGLLVEGAFLHACDDGRWLAIYGLWEELDEIAAWKALARAADSLVSRPGEWKLATGRGTLRRMLDLGDHPVLHLRGRATAELADLLESAAPAPEKIPLWIAMSPPPPEVAIGWAADPATPADTPFRLLPADPPAPAVAP